jgi:hypothetical protein
MGGNWGAINKAAQEVKPTDRPTFETPEDKFESAIEQIVREDDDLFRDDERGEKAMQKLKDIYSEKINSANSYNYRQVDSFFSNRYDKYKKN